MSTTRDEPGPLWTIAQAAQFLAVSVPTLHRWRYRGYGPPVVKLGGHLRYDPRAVKQWVSDQYDDQSVRRAG